MSRRHRSTTSVTASQSVTLQNLTVENPGINALGHVRLGFYLSTNSVISTAEMFLGYVF
ncbi:MAG: hypothetical protein P8R42_16020 [Candidatus Binatia bacterium]|nr:hypothetical protein [Candidatus Binatia bacterium]